MTILLVSGVGLVFGAVIVAAMLVGGGFLAISSQTTSATTPVVVEVETADNGGDGSTLIYRGVDVYATAVPVETPVAVSVTAVQYILALTDVNIHSGPSTDDEIVGWIADGQIAKITGANEPTGWWRVMCPDDTVGSCWVPSDTQITTPTQPPASAQAEVSSVP
jgi:uncharacterized protein YgiM (DUF1202 family)